jgi:hypothetical protein
MNNRIYPILLSLLLALLIISPARGQDEDELILRLNRDFGYGGMGNDIQGFFSMEIRNPPVDLARVEFTIDGQLLAEDTEAPFKIQFSTDSYALGEHILSAVGYTANGDALHSNDFSMKFVSAEAGWQAALKIIGPILALLLGVILLTFITPYLFGRKQGSIPPGAPRNYGIKGGAICPRCSRPFALRVLSLNLGPFHKLDRCPHCGKWAIQRRRSLDELRAAEAAEIDSGGEYIPEVSAADKLRKDLEDSRYQDS